MAPLSVCLCFLLLLGGISAQTQICSSCAGEVRESSEVSVFCQDRGARVTGRCCVNQTGDGDAVIGLDLGNCSLSHLDFDIPDAIIIMDISQNPLVDLPQEIFRGLEELWYITLPLNLSCPGGRDAWRNVTNTTSSVICHGQSNGCGKARNLTFVCPESSVCAPYGPGFTKCQCAPGYYGYKCLREGSFPMLLFFGILAAVTVAVAFSLWFTQRRKVKNQ